MHPTPDQIKLYVFDLDGTLVDSLADIAEALNDCLTLLGLPTRPVPDYRYLVGEGVPKLAARAIGDQQPHLVDRLAELARARYRARPLYHTRPYDGVPQLVHRLDQGGAQLAVLSNKPHELTRTVVHAFWPAGPFHLIQGYVTEPLRKPHPHYLLDLCHRAGVAPDQACLVGDTPTDIETARRAGTHAIGVTWGFRTRADLEAAGAPAIVDRPTAIA